MSMKTLGSQRLSAQLLSRITAAPIVQAATGAVISTVTIAGVEGTLYRWTATGSVNFATGGRARCVVIGGASDGSSFGNHAGDVFDGWLDVPSGPVTVTVGANGNPGSPSSFGSLAGAPGGPSGGYNMAAGNYSGAGRGLPGAGYSDGVVSNITGADVTYGKSGVAFAGTDYGCGVAGLAGKPGAVFLWVPN